jgi:hypothetical protein
LEIGNGWLSPEQKGFLPGVHGIQEQKMLLECAIEEARSHKQSLTICWLDLANAFLDQLFFSFLILVALRNILSDIYRDNQFQFFVGQQLVAIKPTSGVRQGDESSTLQLSP